MEGDATFDLYETLVGANGLEYQLVAMGNTATKALELLERFAGKVVTLRNVRAKTYQDFPQLQLLDDFEILPETDSKRQRCLKEQQMKRCSLKQLPLQKRGTKVALLPCAIHEVSEQKNTKTGYPYRWTRITDKDGLIQTLMVWGTLAENNKIWQKGSIVDIMGAEVHQTDQRLHLRHAAQVLPNAEPENFKVRTDLQAVPWQKRPS